MNKYRGMPVQAKASLWYTACNFIQHGIAFLVVPIYTRILSTDEYGDWSVFQSWAGILIIFASLNLYCGVYTKTLVDMPDKKEKDRCWRSTCCSKGRRTACCSTTGGRWRCCSSTSRYTRR